MKNYLFFLLFAAVSLTQTQKVQAQGVAQLTVDDEEYTLNIPYMQFGSTAFSLQLNSPLFSEEQFLFRIDWPSVEEITFDGEEVELGDARIKFEINATDEDGGIQIFIDADPWEWMQIYSPDGELVYQSTTSGNIGEQGGTELFLESGEPEFSELSLEDLLERFPEGEYQFIGRGLEDERFFGTATLTHNIANGPELLFPLEEDGLQDANNLTVMWELVSPANGSPIIAYQVLVVSLESDFSAIPKFVLDVMMPATATSLLVPAGFLLPDAEYEWEVLALEESGNQTLSSSFFTTAP